MLIVSEMKLNLQCFIMNTGSGDIFQKGKSIVFGASGTFPFEYFSRPPNWTKHTSTVHALALFIASRLIVALYQIFL